MKVKLQSTTKIVEVKPSHGAQPILCRVWEGETETGVKVQALIPRIAAEAGQDLEQFERELQECSAPSVDVQMFPMRMTLV